MNKLLLIFFSIWQLGCLHAQSAVYHPFSIDRAAWLKENAFSSGTTNYLRHEMHGDTIITGKTYKKIYQIDPSVNYYIGGLREDVGLKKVYFCPSGGTEQLLYNFDLAIGDTVNGAIPGDTITVQSIDSTKVGNAYHKVFILKSKRQNAAGMLIEGVGHSGGLFEHYVYTFEFGRKLLCFSVNNIRLYPIPMGDPYTCKLTVGMTELRDNKIQVIAVPNPTAGFTSLTIDCQSKYTVCIMNTLGQNMHTMTDLTIGSLTLDLANYEAGIYYIQIKDDKGNVAIKKIVKQ
jgi:hypothetical protein